MGSNVGGVNLKLLIDRENNRVLFAEVGKEFVDFIFHESRISLLTRFNIKDLGVLEEREIDVSMNKAVKLLKASLQSKRALTDAFLGNKGEVKVN